MTMYTIYRITNDSDWDDVYYPTKAEAQEAFSAAICAAWADNEDRADKPETNITLEALRVPFVGKRSICALLNKMGYVRDEKIIDDVLVQGYELTTYVRNGRVLKERPVF